MSFLFPARVGAECGDEVERRERCSSAQRGRRRGGADGDIADWGQVRKKMIIKATKGCRRRRRSGERD